MRQNAFAVGEVTALPHLAYNRQQQSEASLGV